MNTERTSSEICAGMVVGQQYVLECLLARGTFSTVWRGVSRRTGQNVAIKSELADKRVVGQLAHEARIYQCLADTAGKPEGFLTVHWFGVQGPNRWLVTNLLSHSLADSAHPPPRLEELACGLASRLKTMHMTGLLHRDVRPENVMFDHQGVLYLVDMGFSVVDSDGPPPASVIGTMEYISLNVHLGFRPSRADDVESAAYVLLYAALGRRLPWGRMGVASKVFECKKRAKQIEGLPAWLRELLENPASDLALDTIINATKPV